MNQIGAVVEREADPVAELEPAGSGRYDPGGGPVTELEHREHGFGLIFDLEVQRRQFDADDQYHRIALRPDDMARGPQRGNPGIAAHESDQDALDRRRQAQLPREDLVDPRRNEARAARDDDMRHARCVERIAQVRDRLHRQRGGVCRVSSHTCGGRRQAGDIVEPARGDGRSALARRGQHRPAVRDSRSRRHAGEQRADAIAGQARGRPVDEGLVDVMIRNGGGKGIEPGERGGAHWALVRPKQGLPPADKRPFRFTTD